MSEAAQAGNGDFRPSPSGSSGNVIFILLLLACGVLTAAGAILVSDSAASHGRIAAGAVLLACGILGILLSTLALAVVSHLRHTALGTASTLGNIQSTLSDRLAAISVMLNVVSEQQLISDRAKAVAYREKDRDALRRAIREEMGRGDWEAARALVNDMEAAFGYRQEAERFRSEISEHQEGTMRRLIAETQDRIDRLVRSEDWAGAQQEAARFIAVNPDYQPGRALVSDVEKKRETHKRRLLDNFNDAVERHDSDAGIQFLKMLDPYLTPAEGERLAEAARSIFTDRKNKLRTMITAAVQAKDWNEAIRIGEQIQKEFPNIKFSQEVAEMMPTLRDRAAGKIVDEPVEVAAE